MTAGSAMASSKGSGNLSSRRHLLGLLGLQTSVQCAVQKVDSFIDGADELNVASFLDYGCYCGSELTAVAKDGVPVDAIDACCKQHGECWATVDSMSGMESRAPGVHECEIAVHLLECSLENEPRCGPSGGLRGSIGDGCCECDAAFSTCLANALQSNVPFSLYDSKYHDWSDPPDVFGLTKLLHANSSQCGPETPSVLRQLHTAITTGNGIASEFALLRSGNLTDAVSSLFATYKADVLEDLENKTASEAMKFVDDSYDKIMASIRRAKDDSETALFDLANAAANQEDAIMSRVDTWNSMMATNIERVTANLQNQQEVAKKNGAVAIEAWQNAMARVQGWYASITPLFSPESWSNGLAEESLKNLFPTYAAKEYTDDIGG